MDDVAVVVVATSACIVLLAVLVLTVLLCQRKLHDLEEQDEETLVSEEVETGFNGLPGDDDFRGGSTFPEFPSGNNTFSRAGEVHATASIYPYRGGLPTEGVPAVTTFRQSQLRSSDVTYSPDGHPPNSDSSEATIEDESVGRSGLAASFGVILLEESSTDDPPAIDIATVDMAEVVPSRIFLQKASSNVGGKSEPDIESESKYESSWEQQEEGWKKFALYGDDSTQSSYSNASYDSSTEVDEDADNARMENLAHMNADSFRVNIPRL